MNQAATIAVEPLELSEILVKRIDIDIYGDRMRQNFSEILYGWATQPPVYTGQGEELQVVCSRFADVMEVFRDRARFSVEIPNASSVSDRFLGMESLGQLDGVRHDRLRRLMAPSFGPASIQRQAAVIEDEISALIDTIPLVDGQFDAMADFAMHLVVRVLLGRMLAMNATQIEGFIAAGTAISQASHLQPGEPVPDAIVQSFATARSTVEALIEERRRNPGSDLVSSLIAAREEGEKLSDTELFDQIFILCAAALTTTAGSMGGLLLCLCRDPAQFDRVKADATLISQTVEEGLRRHGPGFLPFARFAVEDTSVGGTFIPKGTPVFASFQGACYDPQAFPDPMRFDIDRKPKGILIFGAGTHHCLGQVLARMILTTSLRLLIKRFPRLALADPRFVPRYHGEIGEVLLTELRLTTL